MGARSWSSRSTSPSRGRSRVYSLIEHCHHHSKIAAEPECPLITGRQGAGKTTLRRTYSRRYPRQATRDGIAVPVLDAAIPVPATVKHLVTELLSSLGDPMPNKGTVVTQTRRLKTLIRECRVELIILDEFQHFIDRDSNVILVTVSNWLKDLLNETGVPMTLIGMPYSDVTNRFARRLTRYFLGALDNFPFVNSDTRTKRKASWEGSAPGRPQPFRTATLTTAGAHMNGNQRSRALGTTPAQALHPAVEDSNHKQNLNGASAFSTLLQQLSAGIRKEDIKQREGWTDRRGQVHYVDYVEWPTVADLLDKLAPTWSHAVRNIVQIGQFVAATAAITINGVTREGVGTGSAESETGIKKAEHDALKRAAVKFGIARDLYRDEDKPGDVSREPERRWPALSTANPKAQSLASLITPKQLYLIRREAASRGLDPEAVCQELHQAKLEEISKRAASALIEHLKAMPGE